MSAPITPPTPVPAPSFFAENWDKLLSAIIGGVVGFFAAIIAMKGDVATLAQRLVVVETTQSTSIQPKLINLDKNLAEMQLIEQRLAILEKKDETATMTTKLLEERLKTLQIDTLKELKDLLQPPKTTGL